MFVLCLDPEKDSIYVKITTSIHKIASLQGHKIESLSSDRQGQGIPNSSVLRRNPKTKT